MLPYSLDSFVPSLARSPPSSTSSPSWKSSLNPDTPDTALAVLVSLSTLTQQSGAHS